MSLHRIPGWTDIGEGRVQHDRTGRVVHIRQIRPSGRYKLLEFTNEQWEVLERLAKKRKRTPQQCVNDIIESVAYALDNPWQHPAKAKVVGGD